SPPKSDVMIGYPLADARERRKMYQDGNSENIMKTAVSISLGPESLDYDVETEFLGQKFRVIRIGTNQDEAKAEALIKQWESRADAIGLGMVRDHYNVGSHRFIQESTKRLEDLVTTIPITTGA